MSMVSLFRRPAQVFVLSLSLTACSTDDLSPPARIDSSARVSAIQPVRDHARGRRETAYPSAETPVSTFSENSDDAVPVDPRMRTGERLPLIDSEPMNEAQQPSAMASVQPMTVPPEGVNMDAMLGVEPASVPVVGLAEEQNRDIAVGDEIAAGNEIAEGNTSQPVVGGIGGDRVQQLGGPQGAMASAEADPGYDPDLPPLSREKIAAEEARKAQFLEQQQRVMLRRQQAQEEQQVAFLPRAENPLSEPDFTGRMPAAEVACRQRLKKLRVEFRDIPRIYDGKACGIDYPIELTGLSGGIDVKPAVKLNCEVTEAFALWVKNELAPSARYRYFSGVKTIKPLGGYSCRTMNSRRGNPMSEHARGNAIDVGKFVLKSGKEIDVRKPGFFAFREKGLLKAVRSDSCKYFNTVLGPGSDRQHKDHFHFDLRNRKSGYRHCD